MSNIDGEEVMPWKNVFWNNFSNTVFMADIITLHGFRPNFSDKN